MARRQCFQSAGAAYGSPAATRLGDYLFTAGIGGGTGQADQQAAGAFQNLKAVVESAGFSTDDIVRLWVWLKDWSGQDAVAKPFTDLFPNAGSRPAVAWVHQPELSDAIQVEAIAVKGGTRQSASIPGASFGGDTYPTIAVKADFFATASLQGDRGASTADQAQQIHDRLKAAVEAIGSSPDSVAHLLSWYRDHSSRDIQNGPFVGIFPMPGDRPNRHSIIRSQPEGVEILSEAIGIKGGMRVNYTMHGPRHGGIQGMWNSLPLGVGIGNLVVSAGTMGRDPLTDQNSPDPKEQAEGAFANTLRLLQAAGLTMGDIGHMLVWWKGQEAHDALAAPLQKYFPDAGDRPAFHVIEADLPGDMVVQVEIISVRP